MRNYLNKNAFLLVVCVVIFQDSHASSVSPILEIDDEAKGYLGTIGEHNVLVQLNPQLQIKNIEEINGICSYHVFKPNTEEFPFTIDIKDKTTGEAIIEVIRKELDSFNSKNTGSQSDSNTAVFDTVNARNTQNDPHLKAIVLDCNKKKEFNFLIQAHDCSTPSLSSRKIPVKIQVVDHDDYSLKFEQSGVYTQTLVESDGLYDNFMSVKARDLDCTNNGYACSYKLLLNDLNNVDENFPFKIDSSGSLSTVRPVKSGEFLEFKVRAFDCVAKDSFVDTEVIIKIVEPCIPQFFDYATDVSFVSDHIGPFDSIKTTSCQDKTNEVLKKNDECSIDSVSSIITLKMSNELKEDCSIEKEKCSDKPLETKPMETNSKLVLFSADEEDDDDDDSIEEEMNNEVQTDNRIVPVKELKLESDEDNKLPSNFRSFSKTNENSLKIDFDGKFGKDFTLSAWLRRKPNADPNIKEQVLCGTDSEAMNRHHFGLYFYRGNLKFLLRKEHENGPVGNNNEKDAFYPSLWEWALNEKLLKDSKWHYYEVKFSYPNAVLFIDGEKFTENITNSDIIDAYELSDAKGVGSIASYIGACYHARTKTLLDHFEGDIGNVVLIKKNIELAKIVPVVKCKKACDEYIEMNMVGNENYLGSIVKTSPYEIKAKTSSLLDMTQLIRKISYVNKQTFVKEGARSIVVTTVVECSNTGKAIVLKDLNVRVRLAHQIQEYNVQLEGIKQLFASAMELENGVEPFKDFSILKVPINKIDDTPLVNSDSGDSESTEQESNEKDQSDSVKLSKCLIKITPERNLLDKSSNSEKVMFLQNLLDEYGFKFEETLNTVTISGLQSVENYQTFIRRLTYMITNINEVNKDSLSLVKNKKFYISCYRSEPNIESNTVLIQLNLTRNIDIIVSSENEASPANGQIEDGFIANKQAQKLVVSDEDSDILQRKIEDYTSRNKKMSTSPATIAVVVMCSCAVGFMLVFGAIKIYLSKSHNGGKRKGFPNEENPQMEWDDSGLNITENPLETLEVCKESQTHLHHGNYEDDEEYSSSEEYADSNDSNDDDEEDEYEEENDNIDHQQYGYGAEAEEPGKVVDRELEWDDTSLEIKIRDKQLQKEKLEKELKLSKSFSNKKSNI